MGICAEHIIPLVFAPMVHDATLSTIWTRLALKSFKVQDHKIIVNNINNNNSHNNNNNINKVKTNLLEAVACHNIIIINNNNNSNNNNSLNKRPSNHCQCLTIRSVLE